MKGFWIRGEPTTTRLEDLVVRGLRSCLEVVDEVGMEDSGCGCGIW